jgi:DNA-binding MarR family transcriptional regulator
MRVENVANQRGDECSLRKRGGSVTSSAPPPNRDTVRTESETRVSENRPDSRMTLAAQHAAGAGVPRNVIAHEIAKRFTFLRRVTVGELNRCLAPLGATVPQYQVLIRLAMEGAVSQQELTLDAGLDAAGVSRLVARMAEEKLVSIKVDARDRRRRLVRLTAKGKALIEALAPVVDAAARNMIVGLSEQEEQKLLHLLDRACACVVMSKGAGRGRRSEIPSNMLARMAAAQMQDPSARE